jgi:beta-phosphoglucomutase family hydrolase
MDDPPGEITPRRFDAVLFDLDGVLTDTARIHARAWQETFDAFLRRRGPADDPQLRPFDRDEDYRLYVDGKPRPDGVRDFLASRRITLPEGGPDDPPGAETVTAVGRSKDEMVRRALDGEGVEVYPGTLAWLEQLQRQGIRMAVVSSSSNCRAVLEAAGIASYFEVRVDGNTLEELGLAGKPAPDSFLEAARRLGVDPKRAVVVEDAISGVRAGHDGGFGLVIGVARKGDAEALARSGADRVLGDLSELVS